MVAGRARGRPRARRRLQPPPARGHPEAQGRRSTTAGWAARTTPRPGGCAAPASRRSAAGSRAPSWRAAARWSTSASTSSTTSLFLLGNPKVVAVSASTYDLLAHRRLRRRAPTSRQDRRGRRRADVRRRGPRHGVHAPRRAAGRCSSRPAGPPTARDGDEFGITLYGTDGGAELIVDDYAPERLLRVFTDDGRHGGRHHRAGRAPAAATRPSSSSSSRRSAPGDWNRTTAPARRALAHIVDACYRSAAEQREIRLGSLTARRCSEQRGQLAADQRDGVEILVQQVLAHDPLDARVAQRRDCAATSSSAPTIHPAGGPARNAPASPPMRSVRRPARSCRSTRSRPTTTPVMSENGSGSRPAASQAGSTWSRRSRTSAWSRRRCCTRRRSSSHARARSAGLRVAPAASPRLPHRCGAIIEDAASRSGRARRSPLSGAIIEYASRCTCERRSCLHPDRVSTIGRALLRQITTGRANLSRHVNETRRFSDRAAGSATAVGRRAQPCGDPARGGAPGDRRRARRLSLSRLADAVGMSKSGLFAHSGSRRSCSWRHRRRADHLRGAGARAGHRGRRPIRPAGLRPGVRRPRRDRVFPGGCFFVAAVSELTPTPRARSATTRWGSACTGSRYSRKRSRSHRRRVRSIRPPTRRRSRSASTCSRSWATCSSWPPGTRAPSNAWVARWTPPGGARSGRRRRPSGAQNLRGGPSLTAARAPAILGAG